MSDERWGLRTKGSWVTNRRLALVAAVASGCAVAPGIHMTDPDVEVRAREDVVTARFGRVVAQLASTVGTSWQGWNTSATWEPLGS